MKILRLSWRFDRIDTYIHNLLSAFPTLQVLTNYNHIVCMRYYQIRIFNITVSFNLLKLHVSVICMYAFHYLVSSLKIIFQNMLRSWMSRSITYNTDLKTIIHRSIYIRYPFVILCVISYDFMSVLDSYKHACMSLKTILVYTFSIVASSFKPHVIHAHILTYIHI